MIVPFYSQNIYMPTHCQEETTDFKVVKITDRIPIPTVEPYPRKLVTISPGHSHIIPFLTSLHVSSARIAVYELVLLETSWNSPNCEL